MQAKRYGIKGAQTAQIDAQTERKFLLAAVEAMVKFQSDKGYIAGPVVVQRH